MQMHMPNPTKTRYHWPHFTKKLSHPSRPHMTFEYKSLNLPTVTTAIQKTQSKEDTKNKSHF